MADAQSNGNGNGVYLVFAKEGRKIALSRSLACAIEKVLEQKNQTGTISLHLKNGGIASIESRTTFELADF